MTRVCMRCFSSLRTCTSRGLGLARPTILKQIWRPGNVKGNKHSVCTRVFPFDAAWGPGGLDAQTLTQSVTPQLFAFSLFPYLGFLYHLTVGRKASGAPTLMVAGFYFLLVFVGATIPAGIYAKTVYGTNLANVDWLHGSAESLLTVTNLLIVLGLRQGIFEEQKKLLEEVPQEDVEPQSTASRSRDL